MTSGLVVSDKRVRKALLFAGLTFVHSRAEWLRDECRLMLLAMDAGLMTLDEIDAKLEDMGVLDLVYPELMQP